MENRKDRPYIYDPIETKKEIEESSESKESVDLFPSKGLSII